MKTNGSNPGIPPDVQADLEAVIDALTTGKPLDPETTRRVQERGQQIRKEVFEKHGLLDIGVPAIRELRGELPDVRLTCLTSAGQGPMKTNDEITGFSREVRAELEEAIRIAMSNVRDPEAMKRA